MFQLNSDNIDLSFFFSILTRGLVLYFGFFFSQLDWTLYSMSAPELFSPLNGLGSLVKNFPSQIFIQILLGFYLLFALASLINPRKWLFLLPFTGLTFYFDILHSSFGFMNVQSHGHWMLLTCNLVLFSKAENLKLNQAWGLRFIEVVFVLVYFQSAISKLMKSGVNWAFDGTTLQFAMARQLQPLGEHLSQYGQLSIVMSTGTFFIELLFPILYFLVIKKPYMHLLAIGFHVGTYFLLGIHFFHLWVFSLSYLLSLRPLIKGIITKFFIKFHRFDTITHQL